MKAGSLKPLTKPMNLEADRSWEEVRYCWQQISGEDLSRQRVMQIAQAAINKLKRHVLVTPGLESELLQYLPPHEPDPSPHP